MRFCSFLLLLINSKPAFAASFTVEERVQVMRYWRGHSVLVSAPASAAKDGPWVVRLTPEASLWFYAYNRARGAAKAPPTETTIQNATGGTAEWERWVFDKLALDTAIAGRAAADANAATWSYAIADAQRGAAKSSNPINPADPFFSRIYRLNRPQGLREPGPIPLDLLAAAGNPPPFAAAVAPTQYTVRIDDAPPIVYTDWVAVRDRYAYFRFAQGVMSVGTPVRKMPDAELDPLFAAAGMAPFEQHVVKAVSRLEGGFDSVNTYDTGYLSVGFIQFATLAGGGGSLGEVLRREKADSPAEFEHDFRRLGIDVTEAGLVDVVDADTGAELTGAEAVRKIIDDKRLTAVFQLAGRQSRAFRVAQVRTAKERFYPADDAVTIIVKGQAAAGRVSDVVKSEAGMATLFDRKVNRGSIAPFPDALAKVMEAHGLTSLEQAAAYEREIIAAIKYRVDFLADSSLTQPR